MEIFKITGSVQNYDWGGTEFIPDLIGAKRTGKKSAEYWMGAHANAPSIISTSGYALNEYIQGDPVKNLGKEVFEKFGRLPFLFKVLDVSDMLSIQVHPSKNEAEKGFARENAERVPLTAKHRNYKDDNHKPEIMVALGEFWLLHGFKPEDELVKTLKSTPELSSLLDTFNSGGYFGLYKTIMEESSKETDSRLQPLIDRVLPEYEVGKLSKSDPEYWTAKAYHTFCDDGKLDKGIYSIFFFNIVRAERGEAIFQDAGIPHAYLEGQNIELMANSDNVLRGGLTPKHVDVKELLDHVEFSETVPNILKGDLSSDGLERVYKSKAPDFELSKISISDGQLLERTTRSMEIMIVVEGSVTVSAGEIELTAKKGEVLAVVANSNYRLVAANHTEIYKAACPL